MTQRRTKPNPKRPILLDVEGGALDWPLGAQPWVKPTKVHVADGRMIWLGEPTSWVHHGRGLLEDFLDLGNASEKAIEAYAMRWGVLRLCSHQLPMWHSMPEGGGGCSPRRLKGGLFWEPVEGWRQFSRGANAVIRLASRLRQKAKGDPTDWKFLEECVGFSGLNPPKDVTDGWLQLGMLLTRWHAIGDVRTWHTWSDAGLELRLRGGRLFGALGLQLSIVVCGSQGLASCSGCSKPYIPDRQPRAGQRNYCKDCRKKGVPQRDAAMDYRARRGAGGRQE